MLRFNKQNVLKPQSPLQVTLSGLNIHRNPVSGRWSLVNDYVDYKHSSAGFYELDAANKYLTHYKRIDVEVYRAKYFETSESLAGDSE